MIRHLLRQQAEAAVTRMNAYAFDVCDLMPDVVGYDPDLTREIDPYGHGGAYVVALHVVCQIGNGTWRVVAPFVRAAKVEVCITFEDGTRETLAWEDPYDRDDTCTVHHTLLQGVSEEFSKLVRREVPWTEQGTYTVHLDEGILTLRTGLGNDLDSEVVTDDDVYTALSALTARNNLTTTEVKF